MKKLFRIKSFRFVPILIFIALIGLSLGIGVLNKNIYNTSNDTTAPKDDTWEIVTPTRNENSLIDCQINVECGGGTKQMTQSDCDNAVCCRTNKNAWRFTESKSACDALVKSSPSERAITAATKTYLYLEAVKHPILSGYSQSDFINELAKILDWDSEALIEYEIAILTIESSIQNNKSFSDNNTSQIPSYNNLYKSNQNIQTNNALNNINSTLQQMQLQQSQQNFLNNLQNIMMNTYR